jgi:type IV pilus assembly protein PilA
VPLAQVAAQIGLIVVREPARGPAPPTGPRVVAKAPASAANTAVIVILCVFGGLIVFGAILAAIAIPAYQDYLMRSRVTQAIVAGESLKADVQAFRESEQRCPDNGEGGIGEASSYADAVVASIQVGAHAAGEGACTIVLTLGSDNARLAGKHLDWTLDADGAWQFRSDVEGRYLPRSLRDSPP